MSFIRLFLWFFIFSLCIHIREFLQVDRRRALDKMKWIFTGGEYTYVCYNLYITQVSGFIPFVKNLWLHIKNPYTVIVIYYLYDCALSLCFAPAEQRAGKGNIQKNQTKPADCVITNTNTTHLSISTVRPICHGPDLHHLLIIHKRLKITSYRAEQSQEKSTPVIPFHFRNLIIIRNSGPDNEQRCVFAGGGYRRLWDWWWWMLYIW